MYRRNKNNTYTVIAIIALVVWCLANLGVIAGLLGKIYDVISPFVVGCFLAFVANVLLRPLERGWDRIFANNESKIVAKLKRPVSIVICMLLFFGVFFAIIFLIVPGFSKNILGFVNNIPKFAQEISNWWDGVVAFCAQYGLSVPKLNINPNEIVKAATDYITSSGGVFINSTIETTTMVGGLLVKTFLAIIFAIYILARKERIANISTNATRAIFSEKRADAILTVGSITDKTFTSFISGQFIEAIIFGTLVFIGMIIFNFPFAGMIAVVIGFTALIPVFGAFIGLGIGAFLILLVSPIQAFWFIVFICVLQQLENNLIYPRVVGKSVGLPGLLVLLAVTIGGSGFGFIGMLISVPVVAIIYELFKEFVDRRLKQKGLE